jgi:hypothetical protein
MAGDWIKIRNDLDDDPHVLQLRALLGSPDVDLIVGKLRRLWKYADQHTIDGRIIFADEARIDAIVNYIGFATALRAVGWLEFEAGSAFIPRFDEHNGESAKGRALATRRVQKHRRRVTQERYKSVTREEKRRVEKSKTPLSPPSGAAGGFEQIWKAYPAHRRQAKHIARKAWDELNPAPELISAILAALERANASEQFRKDKGQRVPNFSKWLASEPWTGDRDPPANVVDENLARQAREREATRIEREKAEREGGMEKLAAAIRNGRLTGGPPHA